MVMIAIGMGTATYLLSQAYLKTETTAVNNTTTVTKTVTTSTVVTETEEQPNKITGTLTMSAEATATLQVKQELYAYRFNRWEVKIEAKNIGNETLYYSGFRFEISSMDKKGNVLYEDHVDIGKFSFNVEGSVPPGRTVYHIAELSNHPDVASYQIRVFKPEKCC